MLDTTTRPETTTREDVHGLAKATLDGLFQFIDSEVLPLEEKFRDVLADERKLFRDDGLLIDEVAEARLSVRNMSAEAGFYAMFAPESVGGGGLPSLANVLNVAGRDRK